MVSFRAVEKQFVIINDSKYAMLLGKNDIANSILCYGYVDHDAGLTFQTVAATLYVDGDYSVVDTAEIISLKIRADSVADAEIIPIKNKAFFKQYANIVDNTDEFYYDNQEVIKCREIVELDRFRHPEYPDDIQVVFVKEGVRPEGIWVRSTKLHQMEKGIALLEGTMLNTPHADFGIHTGDTVSFATGVLDEGIRVCFAML